MKKILLAIFLISLAGHLYSQNEIPWNIPGYDYKRLHFGFTVGVNTMDFRIVRSADATLFADLPSIQPGFQVNIVSDLRLNDDLNLRFLPGIDFGQRDLTFFSGTEMNSKMVLEASYIDFPLLLKYRADRYNNCRPYVIGGFSFRYDMSARKEYESDSEVYVRLKPADFYFEAGVGLDTYLSFFKLAPELKVAVGTNNMLVNDPYPDEEEYVESISKLNAFIIMLNFHFE